MKTRNAIKLEIDSLLAKIESKGPKESSLDLLLFQALELYETQNLWQFLCDPNERIQIEAARKIQLHGGEWGFLLAQGLCRSRKPSIRGISIYILGQIKGGLPPFSTQGMPLIIDALKSDRSPYVRAHAAAALGHIGDASSIDYLIAAAADKDDDVRAAVAAALWGAFADHPAAKKSLDKLRHDKSKLVRYWASD